MVQHSKLFNHSCPLPFTATSKLKGLLIVYTLVFLPHFHYLKKNKKQNAVSMLKNVIVAWRLDTPIRGVAQIAYFWSEHYTFWVDKCVEISPKLECGTMNS